MKNKVTVVFVLLLIGTAAARADSITYQFTDFLVPGGFTYVTPTFITTTTTVPVSDLTACTSSGAPILSGCSGVIFKPNSDRLTVLSFSADLLKFSSTFTPLGSRACRLDRLGPQAQFSFYQAL